VTDNLKMKSCQMQCEMEEMKSTWLSRKTFLNEEPH
jgi:hypothetical protein